MAGVSSVLSSVFIDKLLSGTPPMARKNNLGQGVFILSVFLLCIGFGFLIYGMHAWLVLTYTTQAAALLTGGLSLGIAAVLGMLTLLALMYKRRRINKYRHEIKSTLSSAISVLDDEFGGPIRENPKLAVIIASAAGFLLEDRLF
jgi:hypothetical protein